MTGSHADSRVQGEALSIFGHIPGIGPSMAVDLWQLGLRNMEQIATSDPEKMYEEICLQAGGHVDRCVLYVFRCAVAFACDEHLDPELCKWWNWTDERIASRSGQDR